MRQSTFQQLPMLEADTRLHVALARVAPLNSCVAQLSLLRRPAWKQVKSCWLASCSIRPPRGSFWRDCGKPSFTEMGGQRGTPGAVWGTCRHGWCPRRAPSVPPQMGHPVQRLLGWSSQWLLPLPPCQLDGPGFSSTTPTHPCDVGGHMEHAG